MVNSRHSINVVLPWLFNDSLQLQLVESPLEKEFFKQFQSLESGCKFISESTFKSDTKLVQLVIALLFAKVLYHPDPPLYCDNIKEWLIDFLSWAIESPIVWPGDTVHHLVYRSAKDVLNSF